MKKKFPIRGSVVKSLALALAWAVALLASPTAMANAELDRLYAIQTVGFLRSWDNMDGLFSDYVAAAYKDYFSKQSRFLLQDLSRADDILTRSKIPYYKLIADVDVLGQLARSTRSESMIRTRITKEGPKYQFTIDWMHSPKMEIMATESFVLSEPGDGKALGLGDVQAALEGALDRMIAHVPFIAQISGRDNNSVTVNVGSNAKLKKGDTLVISTLDEVKIHPLLKKIVDWRLTQTGKVVIQQVDDRLAFCKVVEEEPGRQIARYQKVVQVIPAKVPLMPAVVDDTKAQEAQEMAETPKVGYIAASLLAGDYSRQYSGGIPSTGFTGGGLLLGAHGQGQIWLTKEFFVDMNVAYGSFGYSQNYMGSGTPSPQSQNGGVSGDYVSFKLAGGYTYLATSDFFGPKGWVKIGYHSMSYDLPPDLVTELTFPVSFGSLFLSVGGQLPIRSNWGAELNLDFGLLNGASSTANTGPVANATDAELFAGFFYRFTPRLALRAGADFTASSIDFTSGYSLSQKNVTFAPALLYYF